MRVIAAQAVHLGHQGHDGVAHFGGEFGFRNAQHAGRGGKRLGRGGAGGPLGIGGLGYGTGAAGGAVAFDFHWLFQTPAAALGLQEAISWRGKFAVN